MNEDFVHRKVFEITKPLFEETHLATQIAKDATRFIPSLAYPDISWKPDDMQIELVEGFALKLWAANARDKISFILFFLFLRP